MREKTIEETYQKKTPLEHILLRPDTYVGSIQMQKSFKWVLPSNGIQFEYQQITYVPALYKIFDQVLVNAADNYHRDRKMNLLKVQINQKLGYVSILNNGKGIPVIIHKEEKIYVPQLIFGHLLTGSNYNDDEKKVVGGRNGYGAKLANIFSLKFIVECGDSNSGKSFKMVWRNNMTQHQEAEITSFGGKDFTKITFYPDFKRFAMSQFDNDIIHLFNKRVYDMAGLLPKVKTFLNERELPINRFLSYVDMYYPPQSTVPKIRDENVDNDRWQVVVSISQGQFRQVSFVNSICTSKGGTHVNYITDQIVQKIQQKIKKKDKNLQVKPFQIKAHLWIFINCLIENPTFDSQTKQTMTLKQSQFGSKCQLSQKMIKEILKSGIVDQIFNQAKAKELSKLARMTGGTKKARITGIPKLEDANEAGTKNSEKCTLILTEGDSAKGMAMNGLEVVGRDYYGVFPLKGKLLNVREANTKTLSANQQIQNILKIMGLQINKKYQDLKSLRYGSIMIMADQDTDGSHIKGLVINFVHHFWPTLFVMDGFIKQFITPILKATKGRQVIPFYTLQDYKTWANNIENIKVWKVKYYKGLGTSTDKEALEYFQNLRRNKIDFQYGGQQDDQAINLIFSRSKIQQRKQWLSRYNPQLSMIYDRPKIHYKQFVDKQFIHFSNADNIRSIGSVIDGFKPGQRKILYSCFKRNLKDQIKVAQLAGYVSQHSAYHHGQMSLTETIVNMAQNFVGSNNINLLMPNGQFGSRNQGGKEHASARYIFTCLSKITRYIFPQGDDHTLTYVEDDGQLVQPQYYVPIIPMVLINGNQGIGTGWSTYIPNFNPRQIVDLLMKKLDETSQYQNILPWFKGFEGEMIAKSESSLEVKGIVQVDPSASTVHIKQLPVGRWTKDHKTFIDSLMTQQKDNPGITGLRQHHTKSKVHFEIEMSEQFIQKYGNNIPAIEKIFKTTSSLSLNNMVAFNSEKMLIKYRSAASILQQFYGVRLKYYQKRKQYLISKLEREVAILSMKQRFILEIVQQTLNIRNVKKIQICEILKKKGYSKFSDFPKVKSTKLHLAQKKQQDQQQDQGQDKKKQSLTQYNYLLSLPLWSLSYQKVQEIKKQCIEKKNQLQILQDTTLQDMWKNDLLEFLKVLDQVQREQQIETNQAEQKLKKNNKKYKPKPNKKKQPQKNKKQQKQKQKQKQKKKVVNWDSDADIKSAASTQKQERSKQKHKPGEKNMFGKKEPKKQQNDLLTRIKAKFSQQQKKSQSQSEYNGTETGLITKPSTIVKTLKDVGKNDDNYQFVRVIKKKKKSKMAIDSQNQSDEEWNEEQ